MTIVSMTGFGRAEGEALGVRFAVELRSVNGRSLDIKLRVPAGFEALERPIRERVNRSLGRGQVSVVVTVQTPNAETRFHVNREALNAYTELSQALVSQGLAGLPRADGLLALRGVIETGEAQTNALPDLELAITQCAEAALENLKLARGEEGAALANVITSALVHLDSLLAAAEVEADIQPAMIRERLNRRLAEWLSEAGLKEERILAEAAVMVGKADVREELDRLRSHIGAAHTLLHAGGSVGRKFDFLLQEFMREANTLCSKSATLALTQIGLELKSTIDQLKEQIQNVE